APVVTPPANVTAEATSAVGALVIYAAATATDAVGVTDLTYSRESGTTFPLGTTIVTVTAKDAANNSGTATFTVTVEDTTAPVVPPPIDLTVEATSAVGALVIYAAATATDAVGVTNLTYSRESGTAFPLGTTIVTVTAKDAANNSGTATFTVTVADTTAPVVTPPADLTVEATSAAGAMVTYAAATATDIVGVTDLRYSRASGTTFPLGATTVTVSAKDAAHNSGTASFTVTVTSLTPLQSWREQHFGTVANADDAADAADPNDNGITNLVEYALGGDPLGGTTGTAILPQLGRSADDASQISFARCVNHTDLTLTVQAADSPAGPWTDLAQSTAGAPFVVLAPGAAAPETGTGDTRNVTVSDLYPVTDPAHPRRFMKLQITNVGEN
ncbi:MAG: HYR domain-containing protein, partial [Verrucomicrobia bacterium]|nr:HYR domain-containing protein [Verrucomicrobiota bacterium]